MPILKPIAGHTKTTSVIRAYLERNGRALAQDFYNLSWDEREMEGYGEAGKSDVAWDREMDETREAYGNDTSWRGRQARTFKHFILSPDPKDRIDLDALRELSGAWALKHFGDHQIAIIYHDDNEGGIPHAHIVVNNTNLQTGRRLHTEHPQDLNRELQKMARERGLTGLSNEYAPRTALERLAIADGEGIENDAADTPRARARKAPRTKQAVYVGRAERGIVEAGSWSWVADIRGRVVIAKTLARSEAEFREILAALDVNVSDSASKSRRPDWIYSLADEPSKKVSGERLGLSFCKASLERRFARANAYHPGQTAREAIRAHADEAIEINDLVELDRLADALEVCSRYSIQSLDDFNRRLGRSSNLAPESQAALVCARDFMAKNRLLPRHAAHQGQRPAQKSAVDRTVPKQGAAGAGEQAKAKQRQIREQEQQRQQRQRRRDR